MTNRDRQRADANRRSRKTLDTLGRCNLNKRGGVGKRAKPKAMASAQSLAFRAYLEEGHSPEEARRLAGLPALR